MIQDPPYQRRTVLDLSTAELVGWVAGIRERLMAGRRAYERMLEVREGIEQEKYKKQFAQHCKMFEKEEASVEKALVKLEARLAKMMGIPLKEKINA